MSEEPSTPGPNQPLTSAQIAAATGPISEIVLNNLFMEAYDCAKNNHSWQKVLSVVSQHPDWLTRITQG